MRLIAALVLNITAVASASSQTLGISIAEMDGFRSSLSESIEKSAKAAGFTTLHASAKNDVATQLADVKQMIAAGASALVVVGVDTRAEEDVAKVVASAGLPLVFVNHEPPSTLLNARTVYVGSDEKESGTLQTREICRRLGGKGGITVLMGELTHPAARMRTHDVHDVLKTPECQGLEILEEQSANWSREQAADITRVWLDGKLKPQAIIANNDAMALGAIDSIKATGATGILVAGIDATDGALQSLASGDLALTILQDAQGQGRVAIELTQKLLRNEPVEAVTYVPFQLVTPADVQTLLAHRAKN